jgi:predicted permease
MPDWREYVRGQLPPLTVSPEREAEIVGELARQLEDAYAEASAAGLSPEEALESASAQFPDWNALARDINAAEQYVPPEPPPPERQVPLTGLLKDIRHALRLLRLNPSFSAVAVLTLAFGIGANTAIFTMVDALALRSLPYPQADRLMCLDTRKPNDPETEAWTSGADFYEMRERTRSFAATVALSPIWSLVLTGRGEADRVEALFVSASLFPMLGVHMQLGRGFLPGEDTRSGGANVVVLSHSFWQTRLGADPKIIGAPLTFDGTSYTVVGVLPADFEFLGEPVAGTASQVEVWVPLGINPLVKNGAVRFLKVIGRLKDGVTPAQAGDEVRALGAALAAEHPETNRGYEMALQPLQERVVGPMRPALFLLLGSVGFILLMACTNISSLLLARAVARQRELAVRAALGASAARLVRQFLTESLVLAGISGLAGGLLGYGLLRLLLVISPPTFLRRSVALDARAVVFTLAAVLLSAVLSSLPAVWRLLRVEIAASLGQAGRAITSTHHRLRSALVVSQVALALVLLVGAGLLTRSFLRLLDVSPGFPTEKVFTVSTQVPSTALAPAQRAAIYQAVRDRILALPDIVSVGAVSRLPLGGQHITSWLWKEGVQAADEKPEIEYRVATPSYFATTGIPLLSGRLFDGSDEPRAASVAVINRAAARRFWPNEDPVGRRIRLGANPPPSAGITIVGVVGDVRHFGLDVEPQPEVIRPYALNPLFSPVLVIRARRATPALLPAIASAIRSVNPEMPVYNEFRMSDLVSKSLAQRRFVMSLLAGFAAAALLLAAVGLYGVATEIVLRRTREIGLRIALGASRGNVLALVFGQGLRLVLAGAAIGCAAAATLTRLMRSLLFEVQPLDGLAFLCAPLLLVATTVLACYAPAWRACRLDPLTALRED